MIMINRENNLISFCQANICNEVAENPNKFETLSKFRLKFNGLCELICNYVIMQDLLGRPIVNNSRNDQYQKDNLNWFQRGDAIILGKPSENHLKTNRVTVIKYTASKAESYTVCQLFLKM